MSTVTTLVRRRVNYQGASDRIRETHGILVAPRTLEKWPDLTGVVVNRQKWMTTDVVDAAIERRITEAEAKLATAA